MGGVLGLIGSLIVTIIIVAIVEKVSKTELPYGWIGNIVVGIIGGFVGQLLLGTWGPHIMGVYLFQTFIGSFVFIVAAKWIIEKTKK